MTSSACALCWLFDKIIWTLKRNIYKYIREEEIIAWVIIRIFYAVSSSNPNKNQIETSWHWKEAKESEKKKYLTSKGLISWSAIASSTMFSVKLKVKEDPRYNSLPYRKKKQSLSSSTSSLSHIPQQPKKSSFLSTKNGKNNKKVRIQTTHEFRSTTSLNGRWTKMHKIVRHCHAWVCWTNFDTLNEKYKM